MGGNSFGNSVFSVSFKDEDLKKPKPLFGAEYNFHLTEVVDCPEFLVHFPTLARLAEQHGLMMIGKQRFQNFFNAKKDAQDGRMLLSRMNALEAFPSRKTVGPEEQYEHVAVQRRTRGCWNSLPGRMGSSHYLHCFRIQEDKISVQRLVCVDIVITPVSKNKLNGIKLQKK